MSFKLPDTEELKTLAGELKLSLDDDEANEFLNYMGGLAQGYEYLDAEADYLPETLAPERQYVIPSAEENPLGAWYVKSSIKATDSGPDYLKPPAQSRELKSYRE